MAKIEKEKVWECPSRRICTGEGLALAALVLWEVSEREESNICHLALVPEALTMTLHTHAPPQFTHT